MPWSMASPSPMLEDAIQSYMAEVVSLFGKP